MSEVLRVEGLTKKFRGITANEDISFTMEAGSVRSIIGPNGAGKTTFLSMLSGHHRPTSGSILYEGEDITRMSVVKRARRGLLRKFQTPAVFDELSVWQNIELAVLAHQAAGPRANARIIEVLETIRLSDKPDALARFLSHGQRQWLEIGILLGAGARLMLLDEPTAGMTSGETTATVDLIRQLADDHQRSIIVIEHDINFIRDLKAPVMVLNLGRILTEGDFEDVSRDPRVRDVYLGH
ncbi:MAG: ATP-binding cassette domain-containing protein [Halomonas sp.]|uniref:ATP-binding cassette domain-containing protein n=1 Tax=Halomonas sp. TaxID=1486246 RepID=UPI0028700D5D|nr:ATP-binding cassette domain-containing protein [Halomonas sp.]MDR9439179.1 ATP-binding cassette domain-containing protein [Halomonas sp.]